MPADPACPATAPATVPPAAPPADVTLRRVTPADGPLVREVRLAMLADYPLGYLETYEAALALSGEDWTARAVGGSEQGDGSYQVLALSQGRAVGSSIGSVEDGTAWWSAVYVAPAHRGTGVLERLLAVVVQRVRGLGLAAVDLEVHEDNVRARAAYRRLGFVPTGERARYPLAPGGWELRLRLTF